VPGGRLVLECGDGQAAGLAEALQSLGYRQVVETSDLAGRDRVVEGSWNGS
jgi:methylase of polypeptide subunit release factors